jgi:DNA-directed RNA polymerase specialized sigma24 family protein
VLKAYEEMSYPEIARLLDRSVGTVKSQMRYALQKLRGTLRELAESHGVV